MITDDNITIYADDITPYSCAQDISSVISELQIIAKKNSITVKISNPGKCYAILSSNTQGGNSL